MTATRPSGELEREFIDVAHQLVRTGLSHGTSGNISLRTADGILISPSGSRLSELRPEGMSLIDLDGSLLAGPVPSKEAPLHCAMYRRDPATRSVIHTHSRFSVACSCLPPWSERSALPPLTPYFVMNVGQVPLIDYAEPGDLDQAEAVYTLGLPLRAVLLQNHGPVVGAETSRAALRILEEIEATCELALRLEGRRARHLTESEAHALAVRYGSPWGG